MKELLIKLTACSDARTKNQQQTAEIVRQYIPIEKWNIDVNLQWN